MLAIETMKKNENIAINKIVAFGDDCNDLAMIQKCGIGVAMGNGTAEIKNAAKYVCGTNNEDGVGKWIEEHLL
jgi:hydroxymethylpyrimidine pyrophosphatase-like HAD family hydrolase